MIRTELEQLVLDTLYDRRKPKTDSCLVVNEAGIELLAGTSEALPIIERVIHDVVIPEFAPGATGGDRFLGLNYVLGAYWVISRKVGSDRAIPFVRDLPESLIVQAVWAIPIFFRKMAEGYNFGCSPGKPLMEFLNELNSAADPTLRGEAGIVLQQMRSQNPANSEG